MLPEEPDLESPRSVAPGWMITFADLLSLLLTFFVLVFATTKVELKDWQRIVQPISSYLTGRTIAVPHVETAASPRPAEHDLAYVSALLQTLVAQVPALAGCRVWHEDHSVVLSLPSGVVMPPLGDVARLLSGLDNHVEILVHGGTDPSPHASVVTDWRRALAYANAIGVEFARLGYTKPLDISGTADLPDSPQAMRVEIAVFDTAEGAHGAP